MKHMIKVAVTFTAEVEVEADTFTQARAAVLENFSCVGPSWQDGNCDKIISWDAPVHPQVKRVLMPINTVGIKQADGSYRAAPPTVWPNVAELNNSARKATEGERLSRLGVQLVEVFTMTPTLKALRLALQMSIETDEDWGYKKTFKVTVGSECDGSDDGYKARVAGDELQEWILERNVCETLIDLLDDGLFSVSRDDLEPFLGVDSVSGIAVMKHLGSLTDLPYSGKLQALEVIHV